MFPSPFRWPSPEEITQGNVRRVLVAGFALVIVLLVAAAVIGIRSIRSIQANAVSLVRQQSVTNRLIDELQRQQSSLAEVFAVLARDPDSVDADSILVQLDEADRQIGRIAAAGARTPQSTLWRRLEDASAAFSGEARRLLSIEEPESFASRDLFRRHEEFIAVVARLIEANYRKVLEAQTQIDERSQRLLRESLLLLGACLLLALAFTALTVRLTAALVRALEWQAGELSRVSWHMLEDQEATARRFSHELHDELGQSLTAVKTNLAAMHSGMDQARLEDCLKLVDEAIGNVRQMSQLLRPTILDDFGLEAGLRWLAEGFTHRTGIEVELRSSLSARLPDQTETHLYRIAQEALTNVARHAGASRVKMELASADGRATLTIADDGHGLTPPPGGKPGGLGMTGMRARARSTGGDISVRSAPGKGVTIEVRVPAGDTAHE